MVPKRFGVIALAVLIGAAVLALGESSRADTPLPVVSVAPASASEPTGKMSFTISLDTPAVGGETVQYATSNGTATAGSDYTDTSGTLSFLAGEQTKTVDVPVLDDNVYEGNETFNFTLSNPSGLTLGSSSSVTGTIIDNETLPVVSIDSVSQDEGNSGTTPYVFRVSLSGPSAMTIQVNWTTIGDTADSADFLGISGLLSWQPNTSDTKVVTVSVNGDTIDEANETFKVELTNPGNVALGNAVGIGTIQNDDAAQTTIKAGDVSVQEPDATTATVNVPVTLSEASGRTITVDYNTLDGTAKSGVDYQPVSGSVTFAPGETQKSIPITVMGDGVPDPNKTFSVAISSNGGETIGKATGVVTITALPPPPVVSLPSTVINTTEGIGTLTVVVSLDKTSTKTITVDAKTADWTAPPRATAGSDYKAVNTTLTFAPGELTKTVQIPIIQDTIPEDNEKFQLTLANPVNATLGNASLLIRINDDDPKTSTTPTTTTTRPTTTTPVTATGGSAKLGPAVTLKPSTVLADRLRVVKFTIGCPATVTVGCAGSLTLTPVSASKPRYGTAGFKIVSGKSATVKVKLLKSAYTLLLKKRKLQVRVLAVVRDGDSLGRISTSFAVLKPVAKAVRKTTAKKTTKPGSTVVVVVGAKPKPKPKVTKPAPKKPDQPISVSIK